MQNFMQPSAGMGVPISGVPQYTGLAALQQRPQQQRQPQQSASFWKGAPGQWSQQSLYDPQQMGAIQQIIQMAMGGLQNPQQGFEPFAQSARQNFQENTLPSIFERFTSMGKGAQSSGAFQGMLSRGASDLESGLAQGASQYGMQNQQLMQNLLGMGLRPTYENVYQQREMSGIEALLPHIAKALGHVGAAAMTGGATLPASGASYASDYFFSPQNPNPGPYNPNYYRG